MCSNETSVNYEGPCETLFILGLSHTYIHPFVYIYSHIFTYIHSSFTDMYSHFHRRVFLLSYIHSTLTYIHIFSLSHIYIYIHSPFTYKLFCSYIHFIFQHILVNYSNLHIFTLFHTYVFFTLTYVHFDSYIYI